jgi:hypothetical protein
MTEDSNITFRYAEEKDCLQELGMTDSSFGREDGDLAEYWKWETSDAYAPAG